MVPAAEGIFKEYEEYGIEDPGIIFLDGEYLMTYRPIPGMGYVLVLQKLKILNPLNGFLLSLKLIFVML